MATRVKPPPPSKISSSTNTALIRISSPTRAPKGLMSNIVRFISAKKNEPAWMLEWRLKAYR